MQTRASGKYMLYSALGIREKVAAMGLFTITRLFAASWRLVCSTAFVFRIWIGTFIEEQVYECFLHMTVASNPNIYL